MKFIHTLWSYLVHFRSDTFSLILGAKFKLEFFERKLKKFLKFEMNSKAELLSKTFIVVHLRFCSEN